jgi:hypothetical protein
MKIWGRRLRCLTVLVFALVFAPLRASASGEKQNVRSTLERICSRVRAWVAKRARSSPNGARGGMGFREGTVGPSRKGVEHRSDARTAPAAVPGLGPETLPANATDEDRQRVVGSALAWLDRKLFASRPGDRTFVLIPDPPTPVDVEALVLPWGDAARAFAWGSGERGRGVATGDRPAAEGLMVALLRSECTYVSVIAVAGRATGAAGLRDESLRQVAAALLGGPREAPRTGDLPPCVGLTYEWGLPHGWFDAHEKGRF